MSCFITAAAEDAADRLRSLLVPHLLSLFLVSHFLPDLSTTEAVIVE